MFLGRNEKTSAKLIAASVWNEVNVEDNARSPEERLKIAKERVRERIKDQRAMRGKAVGFGWEALVISLMTRLAIKLLERWLEKRLFSVGEEGDD